jgi:hypothetical protein
MGAAMGFTPQQVDEMSAWQFMAALDGYIKANSPEKDGLSSKETDELWEWLKDKG